MGVNRSGGQFDGLEETPSGAGLIELPAAIAADQGDGLPVAR